jgi:3-isopropylmalate/(R)-2-methylmalate dehydratase small subunit
LTFKGRVWCFGPDINTEVILPVPVGRLPREQRPQHMFGANRPGWAAQVKPGDILVADRNFGMGSSRPAAQVVKDLGIACLLADSINGLFLRNCFNFAFPALEVPGVRSMFEEGDIAEVDFEIGAVRNLTKGTSSKGQPWPDLALKMLVAGGLVPHLEAQGMLHPAGWSPPKTEPA